MAISITNVHASGNAADQTSYNFSLSGLNTGGRWLVFDTYSQVSAGTANDPSLSGASLTYVPEITSTAPSTTRRFARSYAWNPSTASYTLVVAFAGQTQLRCILHVSEIDGADLTDPTVATTQANGSSNTASATMSAYGDAGNRFLAAHYHPNSEVGTAENTALASTTTETITLQTQWHTTTQDTTPSWTWTTSSVWDEFASEIKVLGAGGGGGGSVDAFGMMGFFGA